MIKIVIEMWEISELSWAENLKTLHRLSDVSIEGTVYGWTLPNGDKGLNSENNMRQINSTHLSIPNRKDKFDPLGKNA